MCCIPATFLHYQLSDEKESHVNTRLDLQKTQERARIPSEDTTGNT
jgi:hypothetical protein